MGTSIHYNKIKFLHMKKNEYFKNLKELNDDFIKTIDTCDQKTIDQFFGSREILFKSLQNIDKTLMSISNNAYSEQNLISIIEDIKKQDDFILSKIKKVMKEISVVLFKIKKHEKYLAI